MVSRYTEITVEVINSYFNGINDKPLLMLFPSTKDMGIVISISCLKYFWLKDVKNYTGQNDYNTGDILKITLPPKQFVRNNKARKRVRCLGTSDGMIRIEDKNECCAKLRILHYERYLEVERGDFNLSTFPDFARARRELHEAEESPISSFLGLDYFINPDTVGSKVFFICGRGLVRETRSFLEEHSIWDVVSENGKLCIEQTLKEFDDYFASLNKEQNNSENFKTILPVIIENMSDSVSSSISDYLNQINLHLKNKLLLSRN